MENEERIKQGKKEREEGQKQEGEKDEGKEES